jgi:hypothetical protein
MELDAYFRSIEDISNYCVANRLSAQNYIKTLIDNEPYRIKKLIDCRKEFLTPSEH